MRYEIQFEDQAGREMQLGCHDTIAEAKAEVERMRLILAEVIDGHYTTMINVRFWDHDLEVMTVLN